MSQKIKKTLSIKEHSGSKYLREIITSADGLVDVYAVLDAFEVKCPGSQHAIKKLLCAGIRGKGSELQDLREARDAIDRAIELREFKEQKVRDK
jgi:hypothetical protein